jgi:hypothetical protein
VDDKEGYVSHSLCYEWIYFQYPFRTEDQYGVHGVVIFHGVELGIKFLSLKNLDYQK